ncbi:LapA family protein [Anaerospora sp.]|uniref:LapA family protein n=1 Tax=Anaerospora sp. TaxID=1960278 RepID=UPI0028968511|nr:LapA family protein [Anaerospora sp.]
MAYVLLVLAIGFAFLIALFAVQNSTMVSVNLLTMSLDASLVLVILGAAALGFLSALMLQLYVQVKMKYQLYKAHSRIRQLEEELAKKPEIAKPDAPKPEEVPVRSV